MPTLGQYSEEMNEPADNTPQGDTPQQQIEFETSKMLAQRVLSGSIDLGSDLSSTLVENFLISTLGASFANAALSTTD